MIMNSTQRATDVTVLPGVPNMPRLKIDSGVAPFPNTTTDFVKILREHGISVEYSVPKDQRSYVALKAFELWLPILEFTQGMLTAVGSGILVELLKSYVHPNHSAHPEGVHQIGQNDDVTSEETTPAILHVEWHVAKPEGERQTFVANGHMPEVLEALEKFEKNVRRDWE